MKQQAGFTLIEVLVALGIVAIALSSGIKASQSLSANAQRQSDVLLAQLCAENQLIALRLSRQLPSVGARSFSCEQAGLSFNGVLTVAATPNPGFRRVDAQVSDAHYPVLRLSTVLGRY